MIKKHNYREDQLSGGYIIPEEEDKVFIMESSINPTTPGDPNDFWEDIDGLNSHKNLWNLDCDVIGCKGPGDFYFGFSTNWKVQVCKDHLDKIIQNNLRSLNSLHLYTNFKEKREYLERKRKLEIPQTIITEEIIIVR